MNPPKDEQAFDGEEIVPLIQEQIQRLEERVQQLQQKMQQLEENLAKMDKVTQSKSILCSCNVAVLCFCLSDHYGTTRTL